MKLQWLSQTLSFTLRSPVQREVHSRRMQNWARMLGRSSWLLVTSLTLLYVIVSVPHAFAQVQMACVPNQPCPLSFLHLSPARAQQLHALGLSSNFYAAYILTLLCSNFLICFMLAAIIFWRRSAERIAMLIAFFLVTEGASGIIQLGYPTNFWMIHHLVWNGIGLLLIAFGEYLSDPFLCLFPDGRFVPRWMSIVVGSELLVTLIIVFCYLFAPAWVRFFPSSVLIGFTIACFLAQLYRYKWVSSPIQRQQTKWVVFGVIVSYVGNVGVSTVLLQFFGPSSVIMTLIAFTIAYVSLVVIPVSIWMAIWRSRLWEIDIIINRTLVYAMLTVCTIGGYMLVVSGLSLLFQIQGNLLVSLFATSMVAVLFQPLRQYLQRAVNRLMYGERDDPYALLSRLGKRIEATLTPEATLSSIAEMVAQTLKLPYIAITLKKAQGYLTVAAYGKPREEVVHLPLVYQQEHIGEIIFSQRAPGELFAPADLRLLDDIARQTSVVAHAIRLNSDLQHSRKRLVTAREEERRRLRRDLHDGLGPTLAGLTLKIGAVRNILPPGLIAADLLLTEVNHDIEYAVRDIRRIVYDLHPSTLDELGLVEAIRSWLPRSTSATRQNSVQIMLEVPEPLPSLPAAVEVATYRIVQEALTNVVRHAQAKTCRVLLLLTKDVLHIEVMDDGIGLTQGQHVGIGLITMRERAAELGGTCKVTAMEPQGTCVQACLPLLKE